MRWHEIISEGPLDNPAFRRWFGKSVIVDAEGNPLRVYHGTSTRPFEKFSLQDATAGMIFFATDPKFASGYASSRLGATTSRVIPCYLRIERLFDFRTKKGQDYASNFWSHVSYNRDGQKIDPWSREQIRIALYGNADVEDHDNPEIHEGELSHDEWMTAIKAGVYPALECYEFLHYIKKYFKCDGVVIVENGSVNYAVFSPNQIKSAISNTGAFNRRSPKIGESKEK